MNHIENNKPASVAVHPELRSILMANPTRESLDTMIEYQLFSQSCQPLAKEIQYLLPFWEQQACQGNGVIAEIIQQILNYFPSFLEDNKLAQANLLRVRILASTPGIVSFPLLEVQEHLTQYLQSSDIIADYPEFGVLAFTDSEIRPLESDLTCYKLSPHSRRYIQNLFYPERCEAILSVLAHLVKHYPIIRICQQSYALMLSLDNPEIWHRHPFCLRLIANRFWDYKFTVALEA